MRSFNGLMPAEHERLALLAEECAEVIMMIGKILRHGYESFNPDKESDGDNRLQLAQELGDVEYAVQLLVKAGEVDRGEIEIATEKAAKRKPRYLHHQQHELPAALKVRP